MTDDGVPEQPSCMKKGGLSGNPAETCGEPEGSGEPEAVPEWMRVFDPAQAETIDVRPILADQGEPFGAVMAVVSSLPADGALIIEAPFNPRPLRRVLGQMGFATYGKSLHDHHWRIWCMREGSAQRRDDDAVSRVGGAAVWTAADGVHIDVRGLAAPAPLYAILSLIDQGRHEGVIIVHHEREPLFLYPELAERGWTHEIIEGESGEVRLILRREPI